MKYLKLFVEGFKSEYYQEIERGDFLKLSLHSKIPFEDRVYVKIISLFDDEWKRDPPGVRNVDGKLKPIDLNFVRQKRIISRIDTLYVNIFQIDDEWFLVSIKHRYFPSLSYEDTSINKSWKCDQWDGLIKLLVDEGIING